MKNFPNVSIIIPAHNAQATLRLCLESVIKLDYPKDSLEVILVDNNSTDSTKEIARSYTVTVLREENVQSSYAARNRGIQHAKGEILAFTDTDCIVSPDWLKKLLTSRSDPEVGCFAGNIVSYKPQTLAEQYADRDDENHNQLRCLTVGYLPYAQTANVAYRKVVFEDIGLFNAKFKSGGDVDFTWRMLKHGKFKIVYEPEAIVYHKHRTSVSGLYRQNRKYGESITDLMKLYPDSCTDTFWFFTDIFHHFFLGLKTFPGNLFRYYRGEISRIDIWVHFLKALCRTGFVVGRIRAQGRKENGTISGIRVVSYFLITSIIRCKGLLQHLKATLSHENSSCK